jgi:prevent-host-death family protein
MAEREPIMTQTIKATEARQQWSQLLNQVFRKERRLLVEKDGIPVAAIVSTDDLRDLQRLQEQREAGQAVLERSWNAFADVNPATVEQEAAATVAAARQKRRAKQGAATPR